MALMFHAYIPQLKNINGLINEDCLQTCKQLALLWCRVQLVDVAKKVTP